MEAWAWGAAARRSEARPRRHHRPERQRRWQGRAVRAYARLPCVLHRPASLSRRIARANVGAWHLPQRGQLPELLCRHRHALERAPTPSATEDVPCRGPTVEAPAAWAKAQRALKGSKLGEAITYLHNQWEGLVRFLDEPHVPLSNNSAERSLRGPVVGRKNFAGCKSVRGTEVASVLYTLIETAKLSGVEPRDYLRAAVEAALTGKPPLLPHVYREQLRAERAAVRTAAVSLSADVS
ncbi:MAG: hypothetical protein JWN04_1 [Myxococcaceae bacterium]|nr:hypothetical protein [Myxococcaceae bacterium]